MGRDVWGTCARGFLLSLLVLAQTASAEVVEERGLAALKRVRVSTQGRRVLNKKLSEVFPSETLAKSTTAVYLVDAVTGKTLYANRIDKPLNPASNVKLISTATVLETLGPSWKYKTRALGRLPDQRGVVSGDLYLLGEGDPTLSVKRLGALSEALVAIGVNKDTGDIVIGENAIRDAMSGASRIVVRGNSKAGEPAQVDVWPRTDFVRIEGRVQTVRSRSRRSRRRHRRRRPRVTFSSRVEETESGPRLVVKVSGKIEKERSDSTTLSSKRPSTFTGHVLRDSLRERGVEVNGNIRVATFGEHLQNTMREDEFPRTLATVESESIEELVAMVNKRSLNGLSDRLVMTAGSVRYGIEPSMEAGIRAMRDWLESVGLNPSDISIDTGSGLSYNTKLTARQLIDVLRTAGGFTDTPPSWAPVFKSSLAVAGVDGTLRRRFQKNEIPGRVIGKTGTLTGIIALSGFATFEGRTIAFSIITNGSRRQNKEHVRRDHERIVAAALDYLENN